MDISTLQNNLDFIKSLYLNKEWKDEDCKNEILEAIEECNTKIEEAFGWSMYKLDEHKPSFEAVEKVVQKFPSTLSYVHEEKIPIQFAAVSTGNAFEYITILAKQGVKHKVGGEDARGGLLSIDPYEDRGLNTLQWFVNVEDDTKDIEEEDTKRLKTLKKLRASGLLLKNDIREHFLLGCSCYELSKERFEYLVKWDPDALITTRVQNKPLIHTMEDISNALHLVLEAGFKYHPKIGGLLFIEDDDGTLGFDYICDEVGVERVMEILNEILSPTRDFPILHHVFIKAPQHKDLFTKKFPWAYHLKDHNGRTLHQALLAAGPDVMNDHEIFFASLSDNKIQTKDPVTTLFPFAAMAVGEYADLDKCFYLLRRQPSVLERRSRTENKRRRKKRKLDADSHGMQK